MITVDCILCNKNLFPACPGPQPPAEWQVCVICAHPFVTLFILVLIQRLGVSVCAHVSLFIVSSLYVCSVICCWELFLSVRSVEQSSQDRMVLLLSTTQKTAAYTIFMFRSAVILILITDLTTDTFTATFSFFLSLSIQRVCLSAKLYFTEVMSKHSLSCHICYQYDMHTLSFCLALFFSSHVLCAVHPIMEISLKLFWHCFKALNIL